LLDRPSILLIVQRRKGTSDRGDFYGNKENFDAAVRQWQADASGPLKDYNCQGAIALKEPRIYEGEEFKALPVDTREYLMSPTVPQIEILTHFPVHFLIPQFSGLDYSCLGIILMNAQSPGEVVFQSSDPKAPFAF
jgi:hypothetical protein